MKKSVYLAGPISGQTYTEATAWRDYVQNNISKDITVYSPMRAKEYLKAEKNLTFKDFGNILSTTKAIMARDYNDAVSADLILVNFNVNHPSPSLGTIMEIAWAYHLHTPVIAIDSPEFNYKKHPMIVEAVSAWSPNLIEAVRLVEHFLLTEERT